MSVAWAVNRLPVSYQVTYEGTHAGEGAFTGGIMKRVLTVMALSAVIGAGAAFAQGNVIKERQDLMKQNGDDMTIVISMLKGEKPYDAKAAGEAVGRINVSALRFVSLFPEGSEKGGNTRAKPEIWKNKKDFEDWGKQLQQDTAKAQAAAAGGLSSMNTALMEVNKTCSGCHDDYRAPEKK